MARTHPGKSHPDVLIRVAAFLDGLGEESEVGPRDDRQLPVALTQYTRCKTKADNNSPKISVFHCIT